MSAADMVNIIRKEVLKTFKNEFNGFELATVIAPYPNLMIKVDGMKVELPAGNLVVCEKLLRNSRVVSLTSQPGTVRNLGDRTAVNSANQASYAYIELKFEDVLKPGDRILVQAALGGQKYIIIDRVVEYG